MKVNMTLKLSGSERESSYLSDVLCRMDYITAVWRPPRRSELTPMIFDMELTHLDLETYIYIMPFECLIL